MNSGCELDDLVAEKVMGYTIKRFIYRGMEGDKEIPSRVWVKENITYNPLNYSNNLKDAWEVVEKLKTIPISKDWQGCFSEKEFPIVITLDGDKKWSVSWQGSYWAIEHEANSEFLPHAICLAALNYAGYNNVR